MSISLLVHGYVVGRGRGELARDPKAAWNDKPIAGIIELSNKINAIAPELLSHGFNIGDLFAAREINVLRNIWFETNTHARPKMRQMLDAIRADSGSLQGTIIVEKMDALLSRADSHSNLERRYVQQIVNGAIAIVELQSESAKSFIQKESVGVDEITNLIRDAADNRAFLRQRFQGITSAINSPINIAEQDIKDSGLKIEPDARYRPVRVGELI